MNDAVLVQIGRAIRAMRKDRKISQRTVASDLSVSSQFLCDVERGRRYAGVERLRLISRALGLDAQSSAMIVRCGCCGASL